MKSTDAFFAHIASPKESPIYTAASLAISKCFKAIFSPYGSGLYLPSTSSAPIIKSK